MEKFVKTFDGGINRETEELFFPASDWSDALDFDPGPANNGQFTNGSGQGFIVPAAVYTAAGEKAIGYAEDRENAKVYFLISASTPKIVEFDRNTGAATTLCSGAALGFTDNTIINGATVLDGHLLWNDTVSLIGHIYIPSMKAGQYTSPLVSSEIRLVKKPPMYPLICRLSKQEDVPRNFISSDSFVFSYRYEYDTGMMSVIAPWSKPVFRNVDYGIDAFNRIDVLVDDREITPKTVINVQLLVKRETDEGFFMFKQMSRSQFVGSLGAETPSTAAADSIPVEVE